MTIMDAISAVDKLAPNAYSQEEKIRWLWEVDSRIKTEVMDVHEGAPIRELIPYTPDTSPDTILLAPAPHDEMYLRYLQAQMDYHNAEYGRYNNAMAMFDTAFEAYAKQYTREHMPLSRGRRFLF